MIELQDLNTAAQALGYADLDCPGGEWIGIGSADPFDRSKDDKQFFICDEGELNEILWDYDLIVLWGDNGYGVTQRSTLADRICAEKNWRCDDSTGSLYEYDDSARAYVYRAPCASLEQLWQLYIN